MFTVVKMNDGEHIACEVEDGTYVIAERFKPAGLKLFYLVEDNNLVTDYTRVEDDILVITMFEYSALLQGRDAPSLCVSKELNFQCYNDFAKFMGSVTKDHTVLVIANSKSRLLIEWYLVHKAIAALNPEGQFYPAFVKGRGLYIGYSALPGNLYPFEPLEVSRLIEFGKISGVTMTERTVAPSSALPAGASTAEYTIAPSRTLPVFNAENTTYIYNKGYYLYMMTSAQDRDFKFRGFQDYPNVLYSYNNGIQIYIATEETFYSYVRKNDIKGFDVTLNLNSDCEYNWEQLFTPPVDPIRAYFEKYDIVPVNESIELSRLHTLLGTNSEDELREAIKVLL